MNIIELAKEAGIETEWSFDFKIRLERFAALVRAEALEEAAKVCEEKYRRGPVYKSWMIADECAAAIRGLK